MTLEEIKNIFDKQISEGTEKLYFSLINGNTMTLERIHVSKIHELVEKLSGYSYTGIETGMPTFKK